METIFALLLIVLVFLLVRGAPGGRSTPDRKRRPAGTERAGPQQPSAPPVSRRQPVPVSEKPGAGPEAVGEPDDGFDAVRQRLASLPAAERREVEAELRRRSEERRADRSAAIRQAEARRDGLLAELVRIHAELGGIEARLLAISRGETAATPSENEALLAQARELGFRRKRIRETEMPEAEAALASALRDEETAKECAARLALLDLEAILLRRRLAADRRPGSRGEKPRTDPGQRRRSPKSDDRGERIREIIRTRGVERLLHFTPGQNLPMILERGLLSRARLEELGLDYRHTDTLRLDRRRNYVSVSITFPNFRMFYTKRQKLRDVPFWAVLEIDPEVLCARPCLFFRTNAASAAYHLEPDDVLETPAALESLFAGRRKSTGAANEPADPQAEVLVKDEIPRSFITGVVVERPEDLRYLPAGVWSIARADPFLFGPPPVQRRVQKG